jgi:3-methyladenine DNA glycosylase AlkD
MTTSEVLSELKAMGSEQIKSIFINHGAPVNQLYGVKVGDMKKLLKPLKGKQEIALELYKTGISDAMYLAALVADGRKMTREQLQNWAETATWNMISEYSVPWVSSESPFALELGLKWIDDSREQVAAAGWSTLACWLSIVPDENIDRSLMLNLLNRIEKEIPQSANRVRYCMNTFIIGLGGYVRDLSNEAILSAKRVGHVRVYQGNTDCKVPDAASYIQKMIDRGPVKKKKTAKC